MDETLLSSSNGKDWMKAKILLIGESLEFFEKLKAFNFLGKESLFLSFSGKDSQRKGGPDYHWEGQSEYFRCHCTSSNV